MSNKGGQYERDVCRALSLWYTRGKRDDLLWRSSQSGGRATQRAKSGKTTAGHYGDICATISAGEKLTRCVTWEAKRGYGDGKMRGGKKRKTKASLTQLVTATRATWKSPSPESLPGFIQQARAARLRAGTRFWALVWKPDNIPAMIFMPDAMFDDLYLGADDSRAPFTIYWPPLGCRMANVAVMLFDDFLKHATPKNFNALRNQTP